jgi:hypothetical protein
MVEFEPTYQYLVDSLMPVSSERDAVRLVDRAIRTAGMEKRVLYEIEEFINICMSLTKEDDRRVRTIGFSATTQARACKLAKLNERLLKLH